MIRIKPEPTTPAKATPAKAPPAKSPAADAKNASIKQIAENAVHGGPKTVKKDKRTGIGKR